MERKQSAQPKSEKQGDYWNMKVTDADFSARVQNASYTGAIETIGELVQKTEEELLLKRHTFGKKGVRQVKEVLATMEMWLGMTYDEYKARLHPSSLL